MAIIPTAIKPLTRVAGSGIDGGGGSMIGTSIGGCSGGTLFGGLRSTNPGGIGTGIVFSFTIGVNGAIGGLALGGPLGGNAGGGLLPGQPGQKNACTDTQSVNIRERVRIINTLYRRATRIRGLLCIRAKAGTVSIGGHHAVQFWGRPLAP